MEWVQGSVRVRWEAHWRHLVNTIEPSVCGDDAAFLTNYSEHLLGLATTTLELVQGLRLGLQLETALLMEYVYT